MTARGGWCLLRVELDDELFLDGDVDLRPLRQLVHEHAQPVGDDLKPGRDRTVALSRDRDLERSRLDRLRLDVDDVVRSHAVARDVDLAAVDQEVPVADELPGLAPRARDAGAV